jgi:hypothetical protein
MSFLSLSSLPLYFFFSFFFFLAFRLTSLPPSFSLMLTRANTRCDRLRLRPPEGDLDPRKAVYIGEPYMFSCEYFWVDYGCEYAISYYARCWVLVLLFVSLCLPTNLPIFLSSAVSLWFWFGLVSSFTFFSCFCFYFISVFRCVGSGECRERAVSFLPRCPLRLPAHWPRSLDGCGCGNGLSSRLSWVVESLENGIPPPLTIFLTSILYSALFFRFLLHFSSLLRLRVYLSVLFVCLVP